MYLYKTLHIHPKVCLRLWEDAGRRGTRPLPPLSLSLSPGRPSPSTILKMPPLPCASGSEQTPVGAAHAPSSPLSTGRPLPSTILKMPPLPCASGSGQPPGTLRVRGSIDRAVKRYVQNHLKISRWVEWFSSGLIDESVVHIDNEAMKRLKMIRRWRHPFQIEHHDN